MDDDHARSSLLRPGSSSRSDTPSGTPLLQKHRAHHSSSTVDDDLDQDYIDRGRSQYNNHPSSPPGHPASYHSSRRTTPSASVANTPQRPTFSRRSTLRSRSPATNARLAARKKYTYAAIFLVVSLISFTVQTELSAYVQRDLGWNKAYCMLWLTHGSWSMLWPVQLVILRLQKRDMPWPIFWKKHVWLVRTTAQMVERQELEVPKGHQAKSPVWYMIKTTAFVTSALTVAGLSWYIAVDLTTPSDLTAIYNCSAFFAYAFSVPLLREPLRWDKSFAVIVAIVGVLIVAYGDSDSPTPTPPPAQPGTGAGAAHARSALSGAGNEAGNRFLGNLVIGAGSVLYGLYEVLYKRFACPPDGCSPGRGMVFANTVGSLIGSFTLFVLWIPLPALHVLGIEVFELPTGATAWWLFLSVVMNATFAGSFLVLISLTSPVLSSVAALLTIFIVAISDWVITGEPLSAAALLGGLMIIVAFVMLAVSTWREMAEEERRKSIDIDDDDAEAEDVDESDKDSDHSE